MRSIENWLIQIQVELPSVASTKALRREFARLLVIMYASRHRICVDYRILEAFTNLEIPIPENVRLFLFADEVVESRRNPFPLSRRAKRRVLEEFYSRVEESLYYLESFEEARGER